MKKIVLILSLVFLYNPVVFSKNTKKNEIIKQDENLFKSIKDKYNVNVYYKDSKTYFPEFWKTKEINPKFVSISSKELKRFPKILDKALSIYSLDNIHKNLKSIYLSKNIIFYNISFGATNFTDSIYLTSNGIENNYTDSYLINLFHHEFSSIFLRNYKFPEDEWNSWNPRNFSYGNGGVDALKNKQDSLQGNEDLYKIGLLSEYSKSAFEEDFNVYSGLILGNPKEFYELYKKYPYIKEKFKIWVKFYNSIDSKINETYLFSF
jgi:hypothetical protein